MDCDVVASSNHRHYISEAELSLRTLVLRSVILPQLNTIVEQEQSYIEFFRDNLLLLGILGIIIFGYLILIIRKRWKQGFLHREDEKK